MMTSMLCWMQHLQALLKHSTALNCRFQELGPSQRRNVPAEEDRSNDFASASVARAVQSISEAAQARPSTKLLDPEALPKLNPPTYPFKRLKKPLKIPQSLENDTHKNKSSRLRRKRPLPGKRWRKLSNLEEKHKTLPVAKKKTKRMLEM
ncbi:protein CHROMATIN REMODELING 8 [Prunus yedoensis var. nudiflora]|uniref:Protein CHROMATIN REMODELING 8 n=1 Tax=Prunus yedoensis var. nudiflora TaxID=2094558 RepID=A0A315APA0_PRUYE|nr:protein CHROMATIN REMODELING 8 [Prunus yedoensis var. nudiflora]